MKVLFQFFLLILFFTSCKSQYKKEILPEVKPLPEEIPFYFGLNNNYPKADSMLIRLTGPDGKLFFENKGYHPVWGLADKGNLKLSGRYTFYVGFFSDSIKWSEFTDYFDIQDDEERLDFSVNVSPYLPNGADIYVNKYYGNKYNVEMIRDWNPRVADSLGDGIAPAYNLRNNYDSAVFGIYRVQSSTFATHWARLHYAAYTQLEKWESGKWEALPVNTCVIEANISKGNTGKSFPGLIYGTSKKDLKGPGRYRIAVEYGINDAITRPPDSLSKEFPNGYYEMHICRSYDEFELKLKTSPRE